MLSSKSLIVLALPFRIEILKSFTWCEVGFKGLFLPPGKLIDLAPFI